MDKNDKISILDDIDIDGKYDVVRLSDKCESVFELDGIELSREYDKKMPLLKSLYTSKKRILKRNINDR